MSGQIPRTFIDDLLARTDIVEIIEARVKLRKTGSNYQALCPFHNEKTPSFTVSQSKQFYYCFGCGAHGNAISFLMEYDKLDFVSAIETLASSLGMEVPKSAQSFEHPNAKNIYQLLTKISKFYEKQLRHSQAAINYLKKRGLTGKICKQYAVGFSPSGWHNLENNFPKEKDLLSQAGMIVNNDYDRFRNRIMFPIRNVRGQVIAFGGRGLDNTNPKYLNSPETSVFHKGSELYGLYEAKQANRKIQRIIIVEGYLDVISLAQHGITYAVATLGTANSAKHMQQLLRITNEIIFCFDGDNAGMAAAWRALENILPLMRDGIKALFLFLPCGEDPDSLVRKEGAKEFISRANKAICLEEFLFHNLQKNADINSLNGRARLAKETNKFLEKMPNGIYQQLLYDKLANLVKIDVEKIKQRNYDNNTKKSASKNTTLPLINQALSLLLNNPALAKHINDPEQLLELTDENKNLLYQIVKLLKEKPNLSTGAILEFWRDNNAISKLAPLAAWEPVIKPNEITTHFISILQRLYQQQREQLIETLHQKAQQNGLLQQEKITLQSLIKNAKIKISSNNLDSCEEKE